jgi:hypothetical protein
LGEALLSLNLVAGADVAASLEMVQLALFKP